MLPEIMSGGTASQASLTTTGMRQGGGEGNVAGLLGDEDDAGNSEASKESRGSSGYRERDRRRSCSALGSQNVIAAHCQRVGFLPQRSGVRMQLPVLINRPEILCVCVYLVTPSIVFNRFSGRNSEPKSLGQCSGWNGKAESPFSVFTGDFKNSLMVFTSLYRVYISSADGGESRSLCHSIPVFFLNDQAGPVSHCRAPNVTGGTD